MTTCGCTVRLAAGRTVEVVFAVAADDDEGAQDPIGLELRAGAWQPSDALRWLLSVLQPGDRVLDLGAHIGTLAVPAAALGAHVTAVEASPGNADLLEAAVEANGLTGRVRVVRAAVADAPGVLEFSDAGPYGTISTARTRADGGRAVDVEATTVDALTAGPDGPPDWMKVDIEGAECAALSAAGTALAAVRGLVVESNGFMLAEHGCSVEALLGLLTGAGLSPYAVAAQTLTPVGGLIQPVTTVDYAVSRGTPPLPDGWALGAPARVDELVRSLVAELGHPVPQHRAYALGVARRAPAAIRWRPAVRRAVRALAGDDNPYARPPG